MSNIKSYFEMRPWEAEAVNDKDTNDLLIKGVLNELKKGKPGDNSIMVGGDTLVFGSIDYYGDYCIYECTVRRASANLVIEGQIMTSSIVGGVN